MRTLAIVLALVATPVAAENLCGPGHEGQNCTPLAVHTLKDGITREFSAGFDEHGNFVTRGDLSPTEAIELMARGLLLDLNRDGTCKAPNLIGCTGLMVNTSTQEPGR